MLIGSISTIAALGLLFLPFYTVFMDEVPDIPHLNVIYLLFVANTVVSYFYSYKRSLIVCDQKKYIETIRTAPLPCPSGRKAGRAIRRILTPERSGIFCGRRRPIPHTTACSIPRS